MAVLATLLTFSLNGPVVKYTKNIFILLASETINVKERDYLIWNIPEIDTLKWSTTLKFRLKAFKGDGLLFYTKRDENILIVELIGGKLRVAGGKITSGMNAFD